MTFLQKMESDLKRITNWLTGGYENLATKPKKKKRSKKKKKYSKRRKTSLSG